MKKWKRDQRGVVRGTRPRKKTLYGWLLGLLLILCMGLLPELTGAPILDGVGENAAPGVEESAAPGAENSGTGEMTVHFLDVGHGDATLVQCDGAAMLIDTGDADHGTAIQSYLRKQNVEELDYLVLTHPDKDHIGGAPVVISKFKINTVFLSDYEKDSSTYRKLIQALDDRGIQAATPEVGEVYALGSAEFTIAAPNGVYEESNNSSIALLLQHGGNRFLFTGDAEKKAEKDMVENAVNLEADVYQVGHHGSKSSSGRKLLDAVTPEYAVISCAPDDPRAEVLNRFRERGIKVFRTDEQGSIIAVSDGDGIHFNCAPSDTWKAAEPEGSAKDKE